MILNLNEVKEISNAVENGEYSARIAIAEVKTSSTGKQMATVAFIIEGPKYVGKYIWQNFMLEGDGAKFSLPKLKQLIEACEPNLNMNAVDVNTVLPALKNKAVTLDVYRYLVKAGDYAGTYANGINKITKGE